MPYDSKNQRLPEHHDIIFTAFSQMGKAIDSRYQATFSLILLLFLSIKGKINFYQLSRFSQRCEQSFRYIFEKRFDFLLFNISLLKPHIQGKVAFAFDPSYINKSGKKTAGVGYFWSGVANRAKWGLELGGLALLDISRKTAFHLQAVQTIDLGEDESLLAFYARQLLKHTQALQELSSYLVVDAYFSKEPFVQKLCDAGFHIISRLRSDAALRYLYQGEQKPRGRKKQYDGKVDYKELSSKYANCVSKTDKEIIYYFQVHADAMKRAINVVIVYQLDKKGRWKHHIYFSTDLKQGWKDILEHYRLRFQIEFLYRDAKQHTGLNDCQARSKNKLDFHWNMSLTAINVAKIVHWLPQKDRYPKVHVPFSMAGIKLLYFNKLYLNLFICMFGICTERQKNKRKIDELLEFGKMAA